MAGLSALSHRSYGNARRYLLESLAVGFPFLPWGRLIWRELIFWLRHRGVKDDILGMVVAIKETTE